MLLTALLDTFQHMPVSQVAWQDGTLQLFLELLTDEGIVGIGERIAGSSYSNHLQDIKSQISLLEEFVGQFVIGQNPLNIERLWDNMYGTRHDLRHPSL